MIKRLFFCLAGLLPVVTGCQEQTHQRTRITTEDLIAVNKKLVESDAKKIKQYVKKNNFPMTETQTGLWYWIISEGVGENAHKGQIISLNYKLSLLDGDLLYSSDSLGVKQFRVGQGGVESGLEEAVLMLSNGSRAKFILPPHLAHGLIGDDNQIPSRAIIIYDVEVIGIK